MKHQVHQPQQPALGILRHQPVHLFILPQAFEGAIGHLRRHVGAVKIEIALPQRQPLRFVVAIDSADSHFRVG